ncbi:MAG TPA: hypothetical protein VFU15_11780, partial [Bacteroidia bacterium]|nr:hypothetical protein [Bacteroidia bacterium]
MKEQLDDNGLDKLFRDKTGSGEVAPPAKAWDNIRRQLDRKPRRKAGWWWTAAFLLFAGAFSAWFFGRNDISFDDRKMTAGDSDYHKPVLSKKDVQPVSSTND